LMNSLAQVPFALIQGFGRPDITAKFHVFELFLYVPLVWLLIKNLGIMGGALAWTFRVILDSVLLFAASREYVKFHHFLDLRLRRCIIAVIMLLSILIILLFFNVFILIKIIYACIVLILFSVGSWKYILDMTEKELLVSYAYRYSHIKRN
jgi:O-antigen/teichoic acid export membrane protein